MEYGLRLGMVPFRRAQAHRVLILVVMEYGLRRRYNSAKQEIVRGLNPCCNGIWSQTAKNTSLVLNVS